MKLTPKIQKAINLATALHDGQERKGDGLPYIVHPYSVALILMDYTEDENVVLAGILHDTIEDTGYTKEQMEEDFGKRVTELVLDVTEADKTLPWQKRKDDYLEHLQTTCHESKLICAADKLHNLQSMREAFYKFGEKAFEKFNAPVDKKLWFYKECLSILENDEDMPPALIEGIKDTILNIEDEEKQSKQENSQNPKPKLSPRRQFGERMSKAFSDGLNRQVLKDHPSQKKEPLSREDWIKQARSANRAFVAGLNRQVLKDTEKSSRLYEWEGKIYRIDLSAPAGSTVLVKEGDTFVSKPDLGKLAATISFEGMRIEEK